MSHELHRCPQEVALYFVFIINCAQKSPIRNIEMGVYNFVPLAVFVLSNPVEDIETEQQA